MADITAAGRIPLLVGGTMLYVKALREGLADLPQADAALRAGSTPKQPRAAGRPCTPNWRRSIRRRRRASSPPMPSASSAHWKSLRLTGRTLGSFFAEQATSALPFRMLNLALVPSDRAELHRRIAERFDAMLKAGLVEEVLMLRGKYRLDAGLPSMRCVGYRQVWDMLEGDPAARRIARPRRVRHAPVRQAATDLAQKHG
jgi:tRNA dimethylallyltransferase